MTLMTHAAHAGRETGRFARSDAWNCGGSWRAGHGGKSEWIWSSSPPRPRHSWKTWRTRSCSSWALPQARKAKNRSFFSEADLVRKETCVVLHLDSTSDVFLVGNILDDEELIETLSSSKIMENKDWGTGQAAGDYSSADCWSPTGLQVF